MKLFTTFGLVSSVLLLSACGPLPEPSSEQHFNVDLPKDDIDPADIQQLINGFGSFVQPGKNRVLLSDVAAKIEVDGSFREILDQIVATREAEAEVECNGRNCRVVSLGNEFTFKVEGVSIPVLGTPNINLQKRIELNLRLADDLSSFEACRMEGVRVRTLGWTRVDGVIMKVLADTLDTLKIDVGPGGDYPNSNCQI